jgi:hypothetical protein
MSKVEVNQISSQCGSTLTIGQSGDTVTLASGATQSGFGRSGTVDWDTTAKTASFTAVSGNGYFVNTTSGAITVTLPASPSGGDIVSIADYAGTAATNNITIARNGSNFEGGTANGQITINRQSVTLIYVDGTQGWVPTSENDSTFQQPLFVTATGGTVTTCGNYKIHTFTGPGTFCVSCGGNAAGSSTVDYLVVAGGGGGGSSWRSGGGGAGGYRESSGAASGCYTASPLGACVSALPVSAQPYPITVGGGGTGGGPCVASRGTNGANSTFSTISSAGGGFGGEYNPGTAANSEGNPGGSGGGGGGEDGGPGAGGSGNTPPVSPPQGNDGGTGNPFGLQRGAGGGGASSGGVPSMPPSSNVGCGGAGVSSSITGSSVARAGGGGGGCYFTSGQVPSGGTGGGGNGGSSPDGSSSQATGGVNGTTNTGGGGGGKAGTCSTNTSGSGGSGVVIIRYKYQ